MQTVKQITFFSHPATEINRSYKMGEVSSFSQAEQELGSLVGFRSATISQDGAALPSIPWAELHFEHGTIEIVGVPFMIREIKKTAV